MRLTGRDKMWKTQIGVKRSFIWDWMKTASESWEWRRNKSSKIQMSTGKITEIITERP